MARHAPNPALKAALKQLATTMKERRDFSAPDEETRRKKVP
jgi:hypothetical protein